MSAGTVKWFDAAKGYGFIRPEDGDRDVFVHISVVARAGVPRLFEGQKVEYELARGRDGRASAARLSVVG